MTKTCSNCGKEKDVSEFYADKSKSSGLSSRCKTCVKFKKEFARKNRASQPRTYQGRPCKKCGGTERLTANRSCIPCTRERDRLRSKKRDRSEYYKDWASQNRDKLNKNGKAYKARNKDDDIFKLKSTMRSMVTRCASDKRDIDRLPYSFDDLKKRIECQFTDGMSWSNYGEWHIDHRIPLKIFFDRGETRLNIVNALSNLQPLWAEENMSKGARYVG